MGNTYKAYIDIDTDFYGGSHTLHSLIALDNDSASKNLFINSIYSVYKISVASLEQTHDCKVSAIIVSHNKASWNRAILKDAKKVGVPTLCIFESASPLFDYDLELDLAFDYICFWSQYQAQEYKKLYPDSKAQAFIVGHSIVDYINKEVKTGQSDPYLTGGLFTLKDKKVFFTYNNISSTEGASLSQMDIVSPISFEQALFHMLCGRTAFFLSSNLDDRLAQLNDILKFKVYEDHKEVFGDVATGHLNSKQNFSSEYFNEMLIKFLPGTIDSNNRNRLYAVVKFIMSTKPALEEHKHNLLRRFNDNFPELLDPFTDQKLKLQQFLDRGIEL